MKVKLKLKEVENGNIHHIISKRYGTGGELIDESCVGYIESRLAHLVNFVETKY